MAFVTPASRSIPDIFADLIGQLALLLRKEGQLARTEVGEKITQVAVALGLIVGGAVLLIPALVILLQAAVAALIEQGGLPAPLASLAIGGFVLLLGLILLLDGANRLKARHL